MDLLTSTAILIGAGWILGKIAERFSLPNLIGMLTAGVLLGPFTFNLLGTSLLTIGPDLRTFALIIILLRAGLSLNLQDLQKIKGPAFALSIIPCLFEGVTVLLFAHFFLDLKLAEAGLLGFTLAAVSPAILVPSMLTLHEQGLGTNKQIPTMLLAGATLDDVFAITFFGSFLFLAKGDGASLLASAGKLPWQIGIGLAIGCAAAYLLAHIYRKVELQKNEELLFALLVAIFLLFISDRLNFAGLLAIMALGLTLQERAKQKAQRLTYGLTKLWSVAQIILFTSLGAEVNISVAGTVGGLGLLTIALGLLGRSAGVWLALIRTNLNCKERLFCVLAYLPKATVQAAIGGIPFAAGLAAGELILALSALAILITAPLGALAITKTGPLFLDQA